MEKRFTLKLTPEQREDVKKQSGYDVTKIELQEGQVLDDRIAPRVSRFIADLDLTKPARLG